MTAIGWKTHPTPYSSQDKFLEINLNVAYL